MAWGRYSMASHASYVIIKVALYFLILVRFQLRARTAVFASLNLANYSEFGLIVGAIALANGWLSGDWLVIIALAFFMNYGSKKSAPVAEK